MPRGGKRDGAGRPPTFRTRLVIHVTAYERQVILSAIDELHRIQQSDEQIPFLSVPIPPATELSDQREHSRN